jgi:hypothetical protein
MQRIDRSEWIVNDVGYCPAIGRNGYLVLCSQWFGYAISDFTIDFPGLYPIEYNVIPLSSIHRVDFLPRSSFFGYTVVRLVVGSDQSEVFEFCVSYPSRWYAGFRDVGISIGGSYHPDPRTFRGLVSSYGPFICFALLGGLLFVIIGVCVRMGFRHTYAIILLYIGLVLPLTSLAIWAISRR